MEVRDGENSAFPNTFPGGRKQMTMTYDYAQEIYSTVGILVRAKGLLVKLVKDVAT